MWESDDDFLLDEYENIEQDVVDQASAAQTVQELEAEITLLEGLENQARQVVHSGEDRKWDELSRLLQDTTHMRDSQNRVRKLIIFTEHRDTLNYLATKIRGVLGSEHAVALIHGGVKRDARRFVQTSFRHDPDVRVLVATDAAGEGVNLQNANLMVNYDLPWNPNRLEQRFGRIHRIGQTDVCHLWNMVAKDTREGAVFQRLFDKLAKQRDALGGRVFDVLGALFDDRSLKDLLIDAIRFGADPQAHEQVLQQVDGALDTQHLQNILHRNALCEEIMNEQRLFAVKAELEKAEARKLQPFFVRAFFTQAFQRFNGTLYPREPGRYKITYVPGEIREHARGIDPILPRYARVCFDKQFVRASVRGDAPMAELLHPGHPLMKSLIRLVLQKHRRALTQGAVLVDADDAGSSPKLILMIDHAVKAGAASGAVVSRRLQFVCLDESGQASDAGWAPHLDLAPLADADKTLIADVLTAPWLSKNLEQHALAYAGTHLVPRHFDEVRRRRTDTVNKTLAAVKERLSREIDFLGDDYSSLKDDENKGKDVRMALENIRRNSEDLKARLAARTAELEAMRHVVSTTPVVVGAALVIPAGLLRQRRGEPAPTANAADAAARARVEQMAMQAVIDAERAAGREVIDVSHEKCGWDITSLPTAQDGQALPTPRHIEVKGRAKGQTTITVSRNEILYGLNQADKFVLAIVWVDGERTEGPFYVKRPFSQDPDWATTSITFDIKHLLTRAESAA